MLVKEVGLETNAETFKCMLLSSERVQDLVSDIKVGTATEGV
jgi:hypothetical protein